LLRKRDYDDAKFGDRAQRARGRFPEKLVASEQAAKAFGIGSRYQVAIRKSLPAAVRDRVAGDSLLLQDRRQMDIHVRVKQPHARNS